MEFGLGDRQIFLPAPKPEFGGQIPWLFDHDARQVRVRIRFQQHILNFIAGIARIYARNAT